jgi:hypothetical protein
LAIVALDYSTSVLKDHKYPGELIHFH